MYKYTASGYSESQSDVNFSVGDQFGDVELFGTLMQFKEIKKAYWQSIGVGGSVAAPICCYDGIAYIGACDKNFYAVDAASGKEIWRFSTDGPVLAGSCFHEDLVIFGSNDSNVYALDRLTGELRWKFKMRSKVLSAPTASEGVIYCGSTEGNLYALDAATGHEVWKFSAYGRLDTPLVLGDIIYTAFSNLYALDKNGSLRWQLKNTSEFCAWEWAHDKDTLYIGSYDFNAYAIDSSTGEIKWRFQMKDAAYPGCIYGNRVYLGSRDGCVYCLNKSNGSLVWSFKGENFMLQPISVSGKIVSPSFDGSVYALDPENGSLVWKFTTNGSVNWAKAYNDKVYFGSWDCNAYCVDANDGSLIWKFRTSMSSPSKLEPPDISSLKVTETTWSMEDDRKQKPEDQEAKISDYGDEFKSSYASGLKSDYVARGKKGYIK